MLLYQQAFGNTFDLGIDLPDSFKDHSYKNDACPCFVHRLEEGRAIVLCVDFEAPEKRECRGNKRFTLELYIQDECRYVILETNVPGVITDKLTAFS